MAGAVEVRAEGDANVLDLPEGRQAEDLKAAGVGEDGAVPVHEAVQAAQLGDGLHPGPEIEVVHVAEDDAGAHGLQLLGGEGLHRGIGAHRHEDRGLHHAAGGGDLSQAGCGRAGGFF